jgi:AcrR family transcriptional regulator
MSPRPYQLGERKVAIEQTRARILEAARELLGSEAGLAGFTIEAVAAQAGVARMTVYYQFRSKGGLLEALFDALAARGGISRLRLAFQNPDPVDALNTLITLFGEFWASDRLVIRRIRALGAIDPEIGNALRARDARRRHAFEVLTDRLAKTRRRLPPKARRDLVNLLYTMTSFETFDTLAGERDMTDVTPTIQTVVRLVVTSAVKHRTALRPA